MKKRIILLVLILAAIAGGTVFVLFWQNNNVVDVTGSNTTAEQLPSPQPDSFRLIATGDMIPHDTVNERAAEASGGYLSLIADVQPVLDRADGVFCNQESPTAGESFGISGYPSFNAPDSFARDLFSAGCNIINLANNHVADRGIAGIAATRDLWNQIGPLAIAGANRSVDEQNTVSTFDILGHTVAFVAFAEYSNNAAIPGYSVNIFSDKLLQQIMGEARQKADYIIVSAHWGVEDQEAVSSVQLDWADKLAAAGADVIIGTGPHVIQTVDKIETENGHTTLVYYSLGNALSTQLKIEELVGGFAVINFELDNDQLVIGDFGMMPVYMHYEWTADQAAREDLLTRYNLQLMPLDAAAEALQRSLFTTTVAEQQSRIEQLINQQVPTTLYSSSDFIQ